MKHPFTKRLLALALSFSLAAALALPALAADGDDGAGGTGVTISGDVYYGTDYVQFDINGGERTDLFYDILYDGAPIHKHVHYVSEGEGVDHVGIEITTAYPNQDKYSIQVYRGIDSSNATTAGIVYLYADLGNGVTDKIGAVVSTATVTKDAFPSTYYYNGQDYNLVANSFNSSTRTCTYTPYTPAALTGSITFVDPNGNIIGSRQTFEIEYGEEEKTIEVYDSVEATDADGNTKTYYPTVQTVNVSYTGQIDFTVLCRTYNTDAKGAYTAKINYVDQATDKTIWTDTVTVKANYLYRLPVTFVHTAPVTDQDGNTADKTAYYDLDVSASEHSGLISSADGKDAYFHFCLGDAGNDPEKTYTVYYNAKDATTAVEWQIHNLAVTVEEGGEWFATPIGGDVTYNVQPGETVTHTPASIDGYVPVQAEYTYSYGDPNLQQDVYYTAAGYVPPESYPVTLQFVNIANNAVLQTETVTATPGADTIISCPASFSVGGNTYVRLDGQNDTYRHSFYSPKRTYTIYYRDINDILYANTVITNIETVLVERVDEGLVYTEDAGALTGGAAGGGAYVTGPGGATGIVNEDTGMNEAVNEEGQSLAEEREEQIAEGETPLAQAPGGEDTATGETITGNEPAQAGLSTALMVGGSAAALALAAVLVVLIVVQRKRNRATKR